MAITSEIALVTNEGRRREAESKIGKGFTLVGFSLGDAGHDPLDPRTALVPDPNQTDCLDTVFGPKALASITFANDNCPVVECFLDQGEAVTAYSSICILGEIISSPVSGDPEIGMTFLYAVSNFGERTKSDNETETIRVGFQG